MSRDLSILGQELCQEFDDQHRQLKKLGFEVQVEMNKQRDELYQQNKIDVSEQQAEKQRLQTEIKTLLISYGDERRSLRRILRKTQIEQTRELKSWLEQSGNHLEAWQKAVQYIHRKY